MIIFATFGIGDQEVTIYTEEEFEKFIEELVDEDHDTTGMDYHEILEYYYGDEMWLCQREIR